MTPEDLLERASRCLVARRGQRWPLLEPAVFWSDGAGLWLQPTTRSPQPGVLASNTGCAAYVPPVGPGDAGLVVHGPLRAYSLRDPVGLALHGATISAAVTALAFRRPGGVLAAVEDAPRKTVRWLRRGPVVARLALDALRSVDPPDEGPGVAPALPTAVAADVRRALAGLRTVTLAFEDEGRLHVTPAVWGAAYALQTPPTATPEPGTAVTVVLAGRRDRVEAGIALHGRVVADGVLLLQAGRAWRGSRCEDIDLTSPVPGGVSLPD